MPKKMHSEAITRGTDHDTWSIAVRRKVESAKFTVSPTHFLSPFLPLPFVNIPRMTLGTLRKV